MEVGVSVESRQEETRTHEGEDWRKSRLFPNGPPRVDRQTLPRLLDDFVRTATVLSSCDARLRQLIGLQLRSHYDCDGAARRQTADQLLIVYFPLLAFTVIISLFSFPAARHRRFYTISNPRSQCLIRDLSNGV